MSFIKELYIFSWICHFFEMYLDVDVFCSILIGIKILFGFRYKSFLQEEELFYVSVFGTKEFIFDWTIIKS